jgi:uncharacterized protein YdaU (DUF1376 family)
VNFYKHHLGDYAADTAHLSWDEDCAYRRLIDAYYKREAPIPVEVREACRLARASTPAQRRAVDVVLREFFDLQDDGWHQKRCDQEIGAANAQAETNRRIAEEREAKKRARRVHESSTESGNDPSTNRSPANMGEREPSQTPDTRLQTPEESARAFPPEKPEPAPPTPPAVEPTAAGLACKAMKQSGLQAVNPGDPRLIALLQQGATLDEFSGIAAEAVAKEKGFAWVLKVVESRRAEAAKLRLAPAEAEPLPWQETPKGVIAKGAELGLPWSEDGWVNGEHMAFPTYKARVLRAAQEQTT